MCVPLPFLSWGVYLLCFLFVCLFTLQMQRFLSILEGTGAVLLLTSATFLVIGTWVHTLEGVLGILFSDSLLSF